MTVSLDEQRANLRFFAGPNAPRFLRLRSLIKSHTPFYAPSCRATVKIMCFGWRVIEDRCVGLWLQRGVRQTCGLMKLKLYLPAQRIVPLIRYSPVCDKIPLSLLPFL